jgi:TfoX/Sxy family transcriptional regulator of competence genes
MTAAPQRPAHDRGLFDALRTLALAEAPDLRTGQMFGCPALYVGRTMAACVLGRQVGLRVPEAVASAACASGRADAFTPYGKRPMREWIALATTAQELPRSADLIAAALAFARDRHGR